MRKLVVAGTAVVLACALWTCSDPERAPEPERETVSDAALRTVAADHYRAQFKVDDGAFSFVASTPVATGMPVWRGRPPVRAWRFEARAASGKTLHEDTLDDPRRIRGEFHSEDVDGHKGEEIDPHHVSVAATEFLVRLPRGTATVHFFDAKGDLGSAVVPPGGAP